MNPQECLDYASELMSYCFWTLISVARHLCQLLSTLLLMCHLICCLEPIHSDSVIQYLASNRCASPLAGRSLLASFCFDLISPTAKCLLSVKLWWVSQFSSHQSEWCLPVWKDDKSNQWIFWIKLETAYPILVSYSLAYLMEKTCLVHTGSIQQFSGL